MDSKNYQDYQNSLRAVLSKALVQGLRRNEEQTKTWEDYKKAHEKVKKGLDILPQELTTNCMVPIGRKALMKGKLVHTNEILVCLGEGYFAKYSAKQAIDVCDRRIKQADEMLVNLEKEKDLFEMRQSLPVDCDIFGDNEHQEIIETYDEEAEKQWRVKHRQRQKEYHQKLAKLRAQEKTEIQTEEDLWQRLDELELQEELQDEIDRLQDDACNYYGEDTQENDYYDEEEDSDFSEEDIANDLIQERLVKLNNSEMPKHQKDLLETENVDKEADRSSALTYNIPNPCQTSSMSSLDTSVIEFESDRSVIDEDKSECSLSSQNDMNCVKDHESEKTGEKSSGQNVSSCFSSQISEKTFGIGEVHSLSSTGTMNNDVIENSVSNKVELERSVRFQSPPVENINEVPTSATAKERDKFSSENTESDDRTARSETNRRRVSFTDKIQINVFEKSMHHAFDEPLRTGQESSSESDVEDEVEKLAIIEDMLSIGADPSLINEQIKGSTENEDDADDIIRIEFMHSDVQPQIPVRSGGDDVIENPSDIYRIFSKPKSILKKSSVNIGDYKNITPPVDETSDSETDELPRGASYTIIVKDVEERRPEVLEVNKPSSKARPLSKFKMARSGIKQ